MLPIARRRTPRFTVPRVWLTTMPRRPMAFWLLVAREVKARRVRLGDLERVREIARALDERLIRNHTHKEE